METRYTYEIHPRRPIKALLAGKVINKPCSMQLTMREALMCIPYGAVYRKFPNHPPIKVTGSNIADLHKSTLEAPKKPSPQEPTGVVKSMPRRDFAVRTEPKTDAITNTNTPKITQPVKTEKNITKNDIIEDSNDSEFEGDEIGTVPVKDEIVKENLIVSPNNVEAGLVMMDDEEEVAAEEEPVVTEETVEEVVEETVTDESEPEVVEEPVVEESTPVEDTIEAPAEEVTEEPVVELAPQPVVKRSRRRRKK